MNNLITKTWKPLLSLLFGVAVMLFGLCLHRTAPDRHSDCRMGTDEAIWSQA